MNPHARTALWAAVFTVVLFLIFFIPLRPPASWTWAYQLLSGLLLPGMFAAAALGIRGGTDGMPATPLVFVFTFLIWWALLDLVYAGWRKL